MIRSFSCEYNRRCRPFLNGSTKKQHVKLKAHKQHGESDVLSKTCSLDLSFCSLNGRWWRKIAVVGPELQEAESWKRFFPRMAPQHSPYEFRTDIVKTTCLSLGLGIWL